MSKKSAKGPNKVYRPYIRGNPRQFTFSGPEWSSGCSATRGTVSKVTKQRMSFSRARPSESLDSISDDEYARADPKIVRSHIKPNRNYDPYADIRSPRIPHMPHDPSKPAVMKHADLPSVPVSNRPKQGAGSRRSVDSHSRSYSVLSTDSSSSDLYSPSIKMPSRSIPTNQELKEDPEELSRRNESNLFTRKRIIKNENAEEIKKEMGVEVDGSRMARIAVKKERESEEREDRYDTGLKVKKARPSEELSRLRKEVVVKTEIKQEIITID